MTSQCKKRSLSEEDKDGSESVNASVGYYEGDSLPWLGCVCGAIHPRPTAVFWIACDGPCRSWYNVAMPCVGLTVHQAGELSSWTCPTCSASVSLALARFLQLPTTLLYRILTFCASPTKRAAVLCHQIAPLCTATNHAVENAPWSILWSLLLRKEYRNVPCLLETPKKLHQNRTSKRQRNGCIGSPKELVQKAHSLLCNHTDDVHTAVSLMAESVVTPLSVLRLRRVLSQHSPFLVDKRSSAGRTLLMACCAADYVDERVVLCCVKELVEKHGADVNALSTAEAPYVDRPVLFFAVARVMPSVVEYLIRVGGACTRININGLFRLVSDPTKTIVGTFTPLGFAKRLKDAQSVPGTKRLISYWAGKLGKCISILSNAEK